MTGAVPLADMPQLEQQLLHSDFRSQPSALEALLAPDFTEVTPVGTIASRSDVIAWLLQKDPAERWQFSDWQLSELADDVRMLRYHAVRCVPASASKGARHVSLWRFDAAGQRWQLSFHQSTKWTI